MVRKTEVSKASIGKYVKLCGVVDSSVKIMVVRIVDIIESDEGSFIKYLKFTGSDDDYNIFKNSENQKKTILKLKSLGFKEEDFMSHCGNKIRKLFKAIHDTNALGVEHYDNLEDAQLAVQEDLK